jgi:uncharacterized protein
MKSVVEEVDALVARVGKHPVWGYGHCARVHALAEELARAEGISYDAEILRVAALLHDVGLYKAYAMREPAEHAKRSALVAQRILNDADFPPQATRTAIEAIEAHPPGAPPGPGAEATLLKDAVALDYLGVVGLSRVLAMVGTEDDVADLRAAVWHAESLRRQIPDLLILETSKDIAYHRGHETDRFMQDLRDATAGLKLL